MPEKIIQTRIINKHATEEEWNASDFIPKQGEFIIYDIDDIYNYERLKIGDGERNATSLPFIDAEENKYITTSGTDTRPKYNNKDLAFTTDIADVAARVAALEAITISVLSGVVEPTSDQGEDGDIFLIVEE